MTDSSHPTSCATNTKLDMQSAKASDDPSILSELIKAKQEAEQASLAKTEFLSNMSHELRTPLNAVLGFAQLLANSQRDTLTDRQRQNISHIIKSGEHLLNLINQVLDLSKIESGQIRLSIEPVQIGPLIDECILMVREMAERRGIIVRARIAPELPSATCDFTRIKQIVLNLLTNAIKYNLENGTVTISACQQGNHICIDVEDTGIGIPASKREDIFKPFSRIGQEFGEHEGTGIGLTITRELVLRMDGHISVESVAGQGSKFSVLMPVSTEISDRTETKARFMNGLTGMRPGKTGTLLYVEDNPANLALMKEIVLEVGHIEMISAHTAELGIELARTRRPDLIVLDINLPGMSGIQAARQLRLLNETRAIPIIGLSASMKKSKSAIEQNREIFDAYVNKPVDVVEMISLFKKYLTSPGK